MATKNQFVDQFGELSTELLLNIAGILSLRLPEGPGMSQLILFEIFSLKYFFRTSDCSKMGEKISSL